MKKPITVTVAREHGNSGDVITTLRDANGEEQKLAVPGDVSAYTALTVLRGFLEAQLNAWKEPAAGEPFLVTDPETGDVSVLVDGVEIERVEDPRARREAMRKAPTDAPPSTQPEGDA